MEMELNLTIESGIGQIIDLDPLGIIPLLFI